MNSDSFEMDFEELKKRWDAIVVEPKSRAELLSMTRASSNPRVRRLRNELIAEICLSVVIVSVVSVVTQLRTVPLWLMAGFILCNAFYLVNNILGFHYLHLLPQSDTIKGGITKDYRRMKTMLTLSTLAGSMMTTFMVFAEIYLPDAAGFAFFILLTPLTCLSFWMADNWRRRAKEMRELLREFEDDVSPEL